MDLFVWRNKGIPHSTCLVEGQEMPTSLYSLDYLCMCSARRNLILEPSSLIYKDLSTSLWSESHMFISYAVEFIILFKMSLERHVSLNALGTSDFTWLSHMHWYEHLIFNHIT